MGVSPYGAIRPARYLRQEKIGIIPKSCRITLPRGFHSDILRADGEAKLRQCFGFLTCLLLCSCFRLGEPTLLGSFLSNPGSF